MSRVERVAGWLLCVFVFSIPLEKVLEVPAVGTVCRLLGMIAFAAFAAAVARRRTIRPPNLALAFALAYVIWSGATYYWSLAPPETLRTLFTSAQLLAMTWMIWDICRGLALQERLLGAYVWGAAAAAVNALVRYAQNQETYYQRYAAAGFEPNDFGVTMALSIPLALYLAGRSGGLLQWAYRAAVALVISAVYLSGSRTSLIATVIAFSLVPLAWRHWQRAQRIAGVALFGLLVLGFYSFAPARSRERITTIPAEITQGTLHNRKQIWKSGLVAWRDHVVLGVGAGAYPEAVRPELGDPDVPGHRYVAHNTFLSVLVECGIVGFGLYALLLATLALYTWVMPSLSRALWGVMLAVWAAGVSTLTWEHRKPGWLIFALIMTEWARSFRAADKLP